MMSSKSQFRSTTELGEKNIGERNRECHCHMCTYHDYLNGNIRTISVVVFERLESVHNHIFEVMNFGALHKRVKIE